MRGILACAFVLLVALANAASPPPLTSIEFQVKLEESKFASAKPGVEAWMEFLNGLEDSKVFSFDFTVKKSSGTAGIRTEDYWDTLLGTIAEKQCKIRHRGYLLGGNVGNGEIIFKCKSHVKDIAAASPTDPADKYEKSSETKVEQNLYLNLVNNNLFQRSTKITGLPLSITPKKIDDLNEYYPEVGKFFGLSKDEPLYAADQVCYYIWTDIEMTIDGKPAEGMLQIKYASKTDCQAHNVIPMEAEFAWKIQRADGDEWDLDLIQDSEEVLEYLSNSAWRHREDIV